jgi:hypothetical protein
VQLRRRTHAQEIAQKSSRGGGASPHWETGRELSKDSTTAEKCARAAWQAKIALNAVTMAAVPCFVLRWAHTAAKRDFGKKKQRAVNSILSVSALAVGEPFAWRFDPASGSSGISVYDSSLDESGSIRVVVGG